MVLLLLQLLLLSMIHLTVHSFTFQRGVSYGTGGTYHENTSQFKDLRSRIAAIGTYGDRVEIESVTIT